VTHWRDTVFALFGRGKAHSINDIVACTMIAHDSVIDVLGGLKCLRKARNTWELGINADVLTRAIAEYDKRANRQVVDAMNLVCQPGDERHNQIESITARGA